MPLIRASVEKLGFKFTDIKILLISHAHWDHDAGSAVIKKLTGARYMVMDADVPVVESGGRRTSSTAARSSHYPPAKVDRVLHDGDQVNSATPCHRAPHARSHQGLHHLDDESERSRQDPQRGNHRKSERERGFNSSTTPNIPRSPRTMRRLSGC